MYRLSQLLTFVALFVVCLSDNFTVPECGKKAKATSLLDLSQTFIKKAKSLYPNCVDDDFNCEQKEKSLAYLDFALKMISDLRKEYPVNPDPVTDPVTDPDTVTAASTVPDPEIVEPVPKPMDCNEVLKSGQKKSGMYDIWPKSLNKTLRVYCDMETDDGGWTVIQRRGNFSTPKDYFYKGWTEYKRGFGNVTEEFWIGNDNIHAITNQANYSIRFDLETVKGEKGYAKYYIFKIGNETTGYRLQISGYSGDAGDAASGNNDMKFSTKDVKNDARRMDETPCADANHGAWWYRDCTWTNPNGQPGINSQKGITWYKWFYEWRSLSGMEMKLKPQFVAPIKNI